MTVSGNYPTPVYVNGYQCNNCAQVAEAKKDINPADPKAGAGGTDAKSVAAPAANHGSAVTFGGSLAAAASSQTSPAGQTQTTVAATTASQAQSASLPPGQGALLDLVA